MRRALEPLADHPAHLRQLLHQVRLRVQPAGRVHDDHVSIARLCGSDRVERDRGGVAAALGADEVRVRALRPDLELLLGGGAKGVGRGDRTLRPCSSSFAASLPIVVVLPVPLTPTTRITLGRAPSSSAPRLAEQARDLLLQRRAEIGRVAPCLETPDELGRRRHAHVGCDQRLLEPLPRSRVTRIEGRHGDLLRERTPALAE